VYQSFLPALKRLLALPFTMRGDGRGWWGVVAVLLAWPFFCLLQLMHWVGFVLDDVLFRGWRGVEVEAPVFVLGPPRSGTTHLHHVLSSDERTTTFRLWECLFGLSVTARKLLLALGRLDRAMGRPLARTSRWLGRRLAGSMDEVHPLAMDAPEEDFLALMPTAQCFLLVVAWPGARWLWDTARLDACADAEERGQLMRYYRACVQKHLYVHGRERRFLSKNASFSGMAEALLETFPDARILACNRAPDKTVPSQLSAIEPGLKVAGFASMPVWLRDRFIELLRDYYRNLYRVAREHPDRVVIVDNADLRDRLEPAVRAAFDALGLEITTRFGARLAAAGKASRNFRSGHRYTLAQYGLTQQCIEEWFSGLDLDGEAVSPCATRDRHG
jgi:hypothetical protein